MLEPRSDRALHLSSLKPHGMRNFPGSPSFSRSFFRITAEQFSLRGVFSNSISYSLLEKRDIDVKLFKHMPKFVYLDFIFFLFAFLDSFLTDKEYEGNEDPFSESQSFFEKE
ncbi:hypothetical protein Tco_0254130, partial [Tanacetum coccineum]